MGMAKKVAIILINFSNTKDTLECLDSLKLVKTDQELIVYVIHFMKNEGLEKIKSHTIEPVVLEQETNLGFSGMNNLGIEKAMADGCDYVMLLNNDTTVDKDFINPLLEVASQNDVGLVSPKIYFSKGREFHKSYAKEQLGRVIWYGGGIIDWDNMLTFHLFVDEVDRGQVAESTKTEYATGCCMLIKSQLIQEVGLMPEKYFMYMEDVVWNLQMQNSGYKSMMVPKSIIWHKNASSSGGSGSKLHQYYQTRNRILTAKEYAPLHTKLSVLKEAWKLWRNSESEMVRQASIDGILGKTGKLKV